MINNSITFLTNTEKLWSDLQVKRLVAALKDAKNKAIDEAVKKATVPLLSENYALKTINKRLKQIINKKNLTNILIFIGGIAGAFTVGFIVGGFGG